MNATNTVTHIRANGLPFAVQFTRSPWAVVRGVPTQTRHPVVRVSRAALLDHLGNEVADMWRQLSGDMRRAIRVAVHQQLRGA